MCNMRDIIISSIILQVVGRSKVDNHQNKLFVGFHSFFLASGGGSKSVKCGSQMYREKEMKKNTCLSAKLTMRFSRLYSLFFINLSLQLLKGSFV